MTETRTPILTARVWHSLTLRFAVALAFADASIVVLALPQIVVRLHTSISHVVWVIVAYNLALIAGAAAIRLFSLPVRPDHALVGGLALFGIASLGSGLSQSLAALIAFRVAQGLGGAVLLCASLPLFASSTRPGDSPLHGWSAAAAIGAAVGPALGGVLTQLFDWRAIFLVQAPLAAAGAIAILAAGGETQGAAQETPSERRYEQLDHVSANAAITFLSAGLMGALFLVVLETINAWGVEPIVAAGVVLTIPFATWIAERAARGGPPIMLGVAGSVLAAVGLLLLSLITHQQLGWMVVLLVICGAALGVGVTGLTPVALTGGGSASGRAAVTVAARDAGLVIALLVLTPIFVNQLKAVQIPATRAGTVAVATAPIPTSAKLELARTLPAAVARAPQSELPNIAPAFEQAAAGEGPVVRAQLAVLEQRLDAIIQRAATHAFKRPMQYAALLAILVLPVLAIGTWFARTRERPQQQASQRPGRFDSSLRGSED